MPKRLKLDKEAYRALDNALDRAEIDAQGDIDLASGADELRCANDNSDDVDTARLVVEELKRNRRALLSLIVLYKDPSPEAGRQLMVKIKDLATKLP